MPNVPIVLIIPSKFESFEDHLRFSQVLSKVVKESGKRVGLIASCDCAHAHDASDPYGFDLAAKQLDAKVCVN
jgi:aromatic ring-opening dioxygenase LigB subunit